MAVSGQGILGGDTASRLRRFAVSLYAAPPDCALEDFCAMLARRGIGGIGLTARAVETHAPEALARLLRTHDLAATSLNSAGYVLHDDPALAAAQAALDIRLFEAAQALGAPVNVILGGTLHAGGLDLRSARQRSAEGLAALAARAAPLGVRLALEPMHPAALGTRSCINQLALARPLVAAHPGMGLTLDFYHSWWDADLAPTIRGQPGSILVAQTCGLDVPPDGSPPRRAPLGTAPPDLAMMLRDLHEAGFAGAIEYEVFWDQIGRPSPEAMLDDAVRDHLALTMRA
jgi:sugar phosphate isomerase/epimerase